VAIPSSILDRPERRSIPALLFASGAWTTAGRLGVGFAALLVNALLAHLLSPASLGSYFTIAGSVLIAGTIAQGGMDLAVVRLPAYYLAKSDKDSAHAIIQAVFLLGVLAAIVTAFTLGAVLAVSSSDLGLVIGATGLILASVWAALFALRGLVSQAFRGLQDFPASAITGGLFDSAALLVILGGATLAGLNLTLEAALALTAAAYLSTVVLGLWLHRRRLHLFASTTLRHVRPVVKQSLPLFGANVSYILIGAGIDAVILAFFRPQGDVALYGAALRVASISAVPYIILQATIPSILADLHARDDMSALAAVTREAGTIAAIAVTGVGVACLVASPQLLSFLYGDYYTRASGLVWVFILGNFVLAITGYAGTALAMTGNQISIMLVTIVGGILSVTLGIAGAYEFGATGLAVATAGTLGLQALALVIVCRRRLGFWTFPGRVPILRGAARRLLYLHSDRLR